MPAGLGADDRTEEVDSLRGVEQGRLARVLEDRDHDAVEHLGRAAQHVDMAERDRVERAGVDGHPHASVPSSARP